MSDDFLEPVSDLAALVEIARNLETTTASLLKASTDIPVRSQQAADTMLFAVEKLWEQAGRHVSDLHDNFQHARDTFAEQNRLAGLALADFERSREALERRLLGALAPELSAGHQQIATAARQAAETISERVGAFEGDLSGLGSTYTKRLEAAAQRVELAAAKFARRTWVALAVCIGAVILPIVGGAIGWQFGVLHEDQTIGDQKAALAWSNTPDGRAGWQLSQLQTGILVDMLDCDQKGWTKKKIDDKPGYIACYPTADGPQPGNQPNGWLIKIEHK